MFKEIYKQGRYTKIDDNRNPHSFKELRGFLVCNNGNDCFSKAYGKVWKITKDNKWIEVCRNITDLSYNEYLKLSKNDKNR